MRFSHCNSTAGVSRNILRETQKNARQDGAQRQSGNTWIYVRKKDQDIAGGEEEQRKEEGQEEVEEEPSRT